MNVHTAGLVRKRPVFCLWHILYPSVQSLSRVRLFATPWTAAHQASLAFTSSWSLPKLMSIEWWCHPVISSSVVPFSSWPQSFPASGSFPMSQLFASGGQSTGASVSASVLPVNTQDWSPLGWTGRISLWSKGFSRVFSNLYSYLSLNFLRSKGNNSHHKELRVRGQETGDGSLSQTQAGAVTVIGSIGWD